MTTSPPPTDLEALSKELEAPDWDATKALHSLYLHRNDKNAVQNICLAMGRLSDEDLLPLLMQFCQLIIVFDMSELQSLLMGRCHHSKHFALKMFFLLQAAVEDETPSLMVKTNRLWKECELAAINAEAQALRSPRLCVQEGSIIKIHKDGASSRPNKNEPKPKAHSIDMAASLPTIPLFHFGSQDTLYTSTSALPHMPYTLSPPPSVSSPARPRSTSSPSSSPTLTSSMPKARSYSEFEELAPVNAETTSLDDVYHAKQEGDTDNDLVPTRTARRLEDTQTSENNSLSKYRNKPPWNKQRVRSVDLSSSESSYTSSSAPILNTEPSSFTASFISPGASPLSTPQNSAPKKPSPIESPDKASTHDSPFLFKLRLLGGEAPDGKKRVYEYFYTELHLINSLFNISTALMSISLNGVQKQKEVRGRALRLFLHQLNAQLIQSEVHLRPPSETPTSPLPVSPSLAPPPSENSELTFGVEIPLVPGWVIVKIHPEDSFCLSSRNRIPYLVLLEVLALGQDKVETPVVQHKPHNHEETVAQIDPDVGEDWVMLHDEAKGDSIIKMGFVESMSEKEKRIRDKSAFSHLPGWRLAGVIVKSGDDLRQEQLASQVITKIHEWFHEIKLPLFLRPYIVLAISSTSGLIECIPDTASIDSLKKRIPNFGTLSNYYICAYGPRNSPKFMVAQTNFVESLAAYSLICYLLQIKDRHNGNILLDTEGHVIHIDFGFMLNMSPGNLGFELAPFKFNAEMLELMGGQNSDMFKYFKTLLLSGLLEVRRHATELLLLVEVMTWHSKMACFSRGGGAQVLAGLRDRLALDKTEEECLALIDTLVYNAMSSWTTQSYDSYQYYTNGIL